MRLEQYLTEKTFSINADVDLVWKKLVKPSYDLHKKGDFEGFVKYLSKGTLLESMNSSELKSKHAKQADKLNPVSIGFYSDNDGNYYNPTGGYLGKTGVIHYAYNSQVISLMRQTNFDPDILKNQVGAQYKRFSNEISEDALKGTIHHELSHWLNDTLHNKNIAKLITKAKTKVAGEDAQGVMKQGHIDANLTWYEIDAQIHALKELKRRHVKEWDTFGWDDVIIMKPSFAAVFRIASNSREYVSFMKNLTKRMHREKLLTKKLSKYPSDTEMMMMLRRI